MELALNVLFALGNIAALGQDAACLTQNVYHEAANQSVRGMKAIATVTLNRVEDDRFPKTICEVVQEKRRGRCQFSWVCSRVKGPTNVVEQRAWAQATVVAAAALLGFKTRAIGDATFYHADYVNPVWNKEMTMVAVIDDHIFFEG